MTVDPPRASMRNPGIDLLRGLAILLVILVHLRIRIPVKDSLVADILPHWLVKALTDRGHEAVYVFFVISGFLITSHALMRWRELHRMDPLAFWARRAARILPCLLVLIAVLSVLHLLNVRGYIIRREGQSLSGAIVGAHRSNGAGWAHRAAGDAHVLSARVESSGQDRRPGGDRRRWPQSWWLPPRSQLPRGRIHAPAPSRALPPLSRGRRQFSTRGGGSNAGIAFRPDRGSHRSGAGPTTPITWRLRIRQSLGTGRIPAWSGWSPSLPSSQEQGRPLRSWAQLVSWSPPVIPEPISPPPPQPWAGHGRLSPISTTR